MVSILGPWFVVSQNVVNSCIDSFGTGGGQDDRSCRVTIVIILMTVNNTTSFNRDSVYKQPFHTQQQQPQGSLSSF